MWKFKVFIDFDQEERWLEQMYKDGYRLKNASFGYSFERGEMEEATIRVDYRTFKNNEDFLDYCTLFEDSGWEHIAGKKSSGHQYFKKRDEKAQDDIFSDKPSRAMRYKRYADVLFSLSMMYLPILVVFHLTGIIDLETVFHPKDLYLTPGLWDKTGVSFWKSFLFETPFALMRGFAWIALPIALLLFLFFGYKANRLYLKHKE